MHDFTLRAYHYALNNQGRYTLMLVALSVFTLPLFNPALLFGMPLILTLVGLALGLALVKPEWQPAFLRHPQGFAKGVSAMMASSAIFILSMMLGYVAVLNMGLDEPNSRNLALLTALPTLGLTGVMWWTALAQIAAPKAGDGPNFPDLTDVPMPADAPNLRSLRKSRTI